MTHMPDMRTPMPAAGYRRGPRAQAWNPMATDIALGDGEARQAAELASMLLALAARQLEDPELAGKTLAVIGFGRVGRLLAQRARYGLEMNIVVFEPDEAVEHYLDRVEGEYVGSIGEALAKADFVSLHCADSPCRSRIVGQRELNAMKPSAVLINIAAANLVDHDALCQSLHFGTIAGAAIDARNYSEPVLRELRACDNLIAWALPSVEELRAAS